MMNEPVNKMELSEQNAILQKAKITKGDLPELLEKKGISYEALRYRRVLRPACKNVFLRLKHLIRLKNVLTIFLLSVSFPVQGDLM